MLGNFEPHQTRSRSWFDENLVKKSGRHAELLTTHIRLAWTLAIVFEFKDPEKAARGNLPLPARPIVLANQVLSLYGILTKLMPLASSVDTRH
jgi:hypothetical protein